MRRTCPSLLESRPQTPCQRLFHLHEGTQRPLVPGRTRRQDSNEDRMKPTSPTEFKALSPGYIHGTPPYKVLGSSLDNLQEHFHSEHWRRPSKKWVDARNNLGGECFLMPAGPDNLNPRFNPPGVTSALVIPLRGNRFYSVENFSSSIGCLRAQG